jgi:hypothetical protein
MTAHNQFGRARHLADLQPVLHPPDIFFAEGRAPRRDLIKGEPSVGRFGELQNVKLDHQRLTVDREKTRTSSFARVMTPLTAPS